MKKSKKIHKKITKIEPFINKYKCEGINFLLEKEDKKKYEENNVTVNINVLYVKKEKNISWFCFKTKFKL